MVVSMRLLTGGGISLDSGGSRIPLTAQSDWDQNDETAIDYIKNRTHYIDGDSDYHLVVPEMNFGSSSISVTAIVAISSTELLQENKRYTCHVTNTLGEVTTYTAIAQQYSSDTSFYGGQCGSDVSPSGSGIYLSFDSDRINIFCDSSLYTGISSRIIDPEKQTYGITHSHLYNAYTFNLYYGIFNGIKKIDSIYLPDSVIQVFENVVIEPYLAEESKSITIRDKTQNRIDHNSYIQWDNTQLDSNARYLITYSIGNGEYVGSKELSVVYGQRGIIVDYTYGLPLALLINNNVEEANYEYVYAELYQQDIFNTVSGVSTVKIERISASNYISEAIIPDSIVRTYELNWNNV